MQRFTRILLLAGILLVLAPAASAQTHVMQEGPGVSVGTAAGNGTPYPSAIRVAAGGQVTDVDVALNFEGHGYPDDLEIVLRSPDNRDVVLMSDDCGGADLVSTTVLGFDDEAPTQLPDEGPCTAGGSVRPTGTSNLFGSPTGPRLSTFRGSPAAGEWRLFVHDDEAGDAGSLRSWTLFLKTVVWNNDPWTGALDINAPGSALTVFAFGPHTNQSASVEALPGKAGPIDERALSCNGARAGRTVWYTLHVPAPGGLRLDAVFRPNVGNGEDLTLWDWDALPLDAVVILSGVDPADGKATGWGGGGPLCQNASGPGVTESVITRVGAGPVRIGVGGVRSPDFGADADNASDGQFELRGQFTADPPPIPDTDADGVLDPADRCPTVAAVAGRDADRDGCTDPTPRIAADVTYKWLQWLRGARLAGARVTTLRARDVPAGARVRVTCARFSTYRGGRVRRTLKSFTVRARRPGVVSLRRAVGALVPRGRRLRVTVTLPGHIGRRVDLVMGRRDLTKVRRCLKIGSTTRSTACSGR